MNSIWGDIAPPVTAAIIAGFVAVSSSLITIYAQRRRENKFRREDRIRSAAAGLIEASTDVGEGDITAHNRVRRFYHLLLLETDSTEVQTSARDLVRTTWNVARDLAGEQRIRERVDAPPAKEIRGRITVFASALRTELGMKELRMDEPEQ